MCLASCSVMTVRVRPVRAQPFWPAAEAGEEVRLHEASRDTHIGLDELAIQIDLDTGGRRAHASQRGCVTAVVIDDLVAAQDVPAEHALQFLIAVSAMGAGRDENGDVLRPHLRHLLEECLEHLDSRLRA